MTESLDRMVAGLHCPCCGGGVTVERTVGEAVPGGVNAVLRCDCYRYAVLEGIPILRQQSPVGTHDDPIVALLDEGDVSGALRIATGLPPPSPPTRRGIGHWLAGALTSGRAGAGDTAANDPLAGLDFRSALYALKPRMFADYLYYRHSNQSFMSATILVCLLRELAGGGPGDMSKGGRQRVLDLSCGLGHTTFLIGALFPHLDVVAVDWDFGNLRLARRFLAPGAQFMCIDAELPLPFADDEFAACLGLDGLHYIRSKVALLAELDRVLECDALWLFPHMHNARQVNVAPGVPLGPDGWQRLLSALPNRVVAESDLLAGFAGQDACDLRSAVPMEHLEASASLAAVATRRVGFFRRHEGLADTIAAAGEALALNPLWRVTASAAGLHMAAHWPSEELRQECALARTVLPESLGLASTDVARAGLDGRGLPDASFQRELIRRFALVPLPPGYPRNSAADADTRHA